MTPSDDALDARNGGPDARHLRLGLVAAADDTERPGAALREEARRDAARGACSQLPEAVGFDHGDELRRRRVEEADDEGGCGPGRGVQLPAGETEAGIRGSHVRQSALRQPQPPARGDLDLAVRHTPEALLDRVDGNAR